MNDALSRIEPLLFEDDVPRELADLAVEICHEASALGRGLHPGTLAELAELVRMANRHPSGLIAGDRTGPDLETTGPDTIERAEAEVQRAIDEAQAAGTLPVPTSVAFLTWVHRSLYATLEPASPGGGSPDSRDRPGRFRSAAPEQSETGRAMPPAASRLEDFMAHFERRFGAAERWASARVIGVASAHHRLNVIRPFAAGNGSVSRLMSHAMVQRAGIGGGGLWSVSRGLTRDLAGYHGMMRLADAPRTGDRHQRGFLSETALREFCAWMLAVMLDEIRSAQAAFALETIEARLRRLLRDRDHDENARNLAIAVLRYGPIDRGDACVVLKTSERTARSAVSRLVQDGVLTSATPKGPVRISFPTAHRGRLFPNLFPDTSSAAEHLRATPPRA